MLLVSLQKPVRLTFDCLFSGPLIRFRSPKKKNWSKVPDRTLRLEVTEKGENFLIP